jgi:hypothetical protein
MQLDTTRDGAAGVGPAARTRPRESCSCGKGDDDVSRADDVPYAGIQVANSVLAGRGVRGEPPEPPPAGRRFMATVFSNVVMGSAPVFTPPSVEWLLGQEDSLGLYVFVDRVTGGGRPAMTVDVLHSADRRNWTVSHTGVVAFWISTTGPSWFWAPVSGTPVGLGFRRLRITLIPVGGTGPLGAIVRIHAAGRAIRG